MGTPACAKAASCISALLSLETLSVHTKDTTLLLYLGLGNSSTLGTHTLAERCLEIRTYYFSGAIFLEVQPSSSSCSELPAGLFLPPALSCQHEGELCCLQGGISRAGAPRAPCRLSLPLLHKEVHTRVLCVPAEPGTLPLSLCAEWVRRAGHYLVLPLHTAMRGREVLSVLDMGLTWTVIISIFAISCSLEKEGK